MHFRKLFKASGAMLSVLLLNGWPVAAQAAAPNPLDGFDFESGPGAWAAQSCNSCGTVWVGNYSGQSEVGPTFEGDGALKWYINNDSGQFNELSVSGDFGETDAEFMSISVWFPGGARSSINDVKPFIKTGPNSENYADFYTGGYSIPEDGWATFVLKINKSTTPASIRSFGLFLDTSGAFHNNLYIDSVKFY